MINYKLVSKKNLSDETAPDKYYSISKANKTIDLRYIATRIARESTVSVVDAKAVLEGFIQVIPDELIRGNNIKLDEFGYFRTTLKSEGAESEIQFTNSNIKKVNVRFRPAKEFSKTLAVAEFKKNS